jgi:hypothetical protein
VSRKPDLRPRLHLRKMGPWCVCYGKDAQVLAKLLNLAVGRDRGREFCGFRIVEQDHFTAMAEDKGMVLVCHGARVA